MPCVTHRAARSTGSPGSRCGLPCSPRPTWSASRTASEELGGCRARRRGGIDPLQLTPGDYVVHEQHGVGRYLEMTSRSIQGAVREYLVIEYAPGKRGQPPDRLYVPTDQLDQVTRYVGGEAPSLHRLGRRRLGQDQGPRAQGGAADRLGADPAVLGADGLARARLRPGHPVAAGAGGRVPLRRDADQLAAIDEVKQDMERPVPMDRLICGDVGYGKTEIAVRAAFKAVQDGSQVAVLVPTTLLAQQHRPRSASGTRRSRWWCARVAGSRATPRRRETLRRADRRARWTWWSAPTGCCPRTPGSPGSAWSSWTRNSGSGWSTRSTSSGCAPRWTCWPCRPPRSRARWRWASPGSGRCPPS